MKGALSETVELARVAETAAAAGADIVTRRFGHGGGRPEGKGRTGDWVTDVDRASEDAIRAHLERATPGIPVVAEEGGGEPSEQYWVVDLLDGTTNFLLGFPVVAVSVALVDNERPVAAAVCGPLLDLSFVAAKGHGARRNGEPITVSLRPPERAIVAMALPFRDRSLMPRYLPTLQRVFDRVEDIRRAGAAALDLAWVAAGVFDGYFELNLSAWDVAAGALLVEEAGGVVTDWEGGPDYLSGNVLAGSMDTHLVLLEATRG